MLTLAAIVLSSIQPAPIIKVTSDNTRIDRSCTIEIAPGTVIADTDGNGVIQIAADNITVTFSSGSNLRGAGADTLADTYKGVGIVIEGRTGVTLKGGAVSGYKVGLLATRCSGLTIDGGDYSANYRQHLKSTPQGEDGSDWLYPHNNDKGEWRTNYGAAICVKDADKVTIHDVLIRRGQNGIILDNVNDSLIYDNDCSFLSGWGLAMWRSNRNLVSRNALDFCVRGYSHGVYNRGQDSAGILMFEQCSQNIFAENSVTHGGDGIFGFAGREAIGEAAPPAGNDGKPFDYKRRGCSDNLFIGNDLSYAPAHGLEMTFSYGNIIVQNRMVENAICGIWGGYSQGTLIAENTFERNGQMAYGLERGGINIEHGSDNLILGNTFNGNKCGVHLWWDDDGNLFKMPGIVANYKDVSGNVVADNTFTGDLIALQLRDGSKEKNRVRGTVFSGNKLSDVKKDLDATTGIEVATSGDSPLYVIPRYKVMGQKRPVGARPQLAGRQNIVMTEWGPWDHQSPLARLVATENGRDVYEFSGIDPRNVVVSGVGINAESSGGTRGKPWRTSVGSAGPGAFAYQVTVKEPGYSKVIDGSLLNVSWDVTVFPWTGVPGPNPPPDLEKWRAASQGPGAVKATSSKLSFAFGGRGPSDMGISDAVTDAKFKSDYFGIIASAKLPLTKGTWRLITTSDDGIRVVADGKVLIENWSHHGSTEDSAELRLDADKVVDLKVEYFEIFGGAVLDLKIQRIP